MFFVFLGLAIADLVLFGGWIWDGFLVDGDPQRVERHQLGGLAVCVLTVFVHSVTFVYFLGTGLAVKEARTNWGIAAEFLHATRRFKLEAYPIAMVAIALTAATGVLGGGVRAEAIPGPIHFTLALLALVTSVAAFVVAARLILRNGYMLGLIRGEIATIRQSAQGEGPVPELDAGEKPLMLRGPDEIKKPPRAFLWGRALFFLGLSTWLLYAYLHWWMGIGALSWVPFAALTLGLVAAGLYLWIRHPLPADVDF